MKGFTNGNYGWSVNGLQSCIKENGLKSQIILYTEDAAVVHVTSYNDSIILGSLTSWCISEHECSWKQYVSDKGNYQVFVYDFSKKPTDELSIIGATFTKDGILMCSFTRPNHPLAEVTKSKNDSEAFEKKIIKKLLGKEWHLPDVFDAIKESTNNEFVEEPIYAQDNDYSVDTWGTYDCSNIWDLYSF